jgi:hypothetical protein
VAAEFSEVFSGNQPHEVAVKADVSGAVLIIISIRLLTLLRTDTVLETSIFMASSSCCFLEKISMRFQMYFKRR